jgi:integrase/recombinase XerD
MGNFRKYLQQRGHSNQSVSSHFRNLSYFLNWCEDENIEADLASYNEVISYINHLRNKGVKQRTIQVYTGSLKHYFKWLIKEEIRDNNPLENLKIQGVKRKHLYHILEKQDLERLYNNFTQPLPQSGKFSPILPAWKRNKVILGLIVYQGLTSRELGMLNVKDVKLREGKIYIPGSRRSNERELNLESHQVIDIMEYILKEREELLKINASAKEKLFISTGRSSRFNNIIAGLMKKLKEQDKQVSSLKQIRASVITHWLKNYNLRQVQYMAGHRYVSSTEAFLINDLEGLQEEIDKFHPIG